MSLQGKLTTGPGPRIRTFFSRPYRDGKKPESVWHKIMKESGMAQKAFFELLTDI